MARLCVAFVALALINNAPALPFEGFGLASRPDGNSLLDCDMALTDASGSYASPGFPDQYPGGLNCRVTIEPGSPFTVRVDALALQSSFLCRADKLLIEVDGSVQGHYCGSQSAFEFEAESKVVIVFTSDASGSAAGFHLVYSTGDLPDPSDVPTEAGQPSSTGFAKCGQTPQLDDRIVNGNESEAHAWPWMVNIVYGDVHLCGGAVYDEYHVITAAHCFPFTLNQAKYVLYFGDHSANEEEAGQQRRLVGSVFSHEHYTKKTMDNDIAIVRLDSPISFSNTVRPVCLPSREVEPDVVATVAGWGDSEDTMDESTLNQAHVPVLPRETCNSRQWYKGKVTENMICAGYPDGGIDSCQGDSGGPLVTMNEDRYELSGIVSWGHGCAEPRKPGVYTNVFNYLTWIQHKLAASNL